MLKRCANIAAVVGFLALFGFLVFHIGAASYSHRLKHAAESLDGNEKGNWYGTFIDHTPDWFVALFTLGLVGITYRLVTATIGLRESTDKLWEAGERQIGIAKRSADIAEASLTKLQRAFVFPEQMQVEIRQVGSQRFFDFDLRWKNSGSTPANDLRMHLNWVQTREELERNFEYPDRGRAEDIPRFVAPGANIWSSTISLDSAAIGSVYLGQTRLYFYGWVSYEDVFDGTPRHRTRFCWQAIPTGTDPSAPAGQMTWAMRSFGHYNSMADDDA